jgi:hypothetical protein
LFGLFRSCQTHFVRSPMKGVGQPTFHLRLYLTIHQIARTPSRQPIFFPSS